MFKVPNEHKKTFLRMFYLNFDVNESAFILFVQPNVKKRKTFKLFIL